MIGRILGMLALVALLAPAVGQTAPRKKKAKAAAHKAATPAPVVEKAPVPVADPAPVAAPTTGEPTPADVAKKIQTFYDQQPGFSAHFVQAVKKKGLATPITREGMAYIKKGDPAKNVPGKMRWDYPNEEIFYFCNGDTLWSYEKRERLATRVPVKNSPLWQATAYLVGQGDLARDFSLSLDKSPLDDAWALKLVPKKGTQVMKSLTLLIDKKTGQVRGSVLVDPLDDSTTLKWQDAKFVPIDDKVFEWSPPAGITVKNLP